MTESWAEAVLDFWFSLKPEQWWKADPELDGAMREQFLEVWEEQQAKLPEQFMADPDTALAGVILFDQFPRNMFRGHADSFSTDHLAIGIAKAAVDRGYDDRLEPIRRGFLYMPFQHSESLDDQRQSLLLFAALGDETQLAFARRHHEVIERFGRFPHRNAVLGRASRPDELTAGDVDPTHL